MPGHVTGNVKILLRLEGLFILVAATLAFSKLNLSWYYFALLFFLPDISFLGYLAGARIGAIAYNCAHSLILPLALLFYAFYASDQNMLKYVFIWLAHIGFDRALGYGLKYADGFKFTHLGIIGKSGQTEA